jgi:hypothetical protein
MINYQLFPKSQQISSDLLAVVNVFQTNEDVISSKTQELSSNEVLAVVADGLEKIGFTIEKSKRKDDKIKIPVLFGRNGNLEKSFDADGVNLTTKTVIEVEAGRGVTNYQFLKDLFQACMMQEIDVLIIAIRNNYKGNSDFETVVTFFDTLYVSGRVTLPLKRILIIGY